MSDPCLPSSRDLRSPRNSCPWRPLVALLVAATCLGAALLHPKDGPDLDLRLRVDDDAVVLRVTLNLALLDLLVDAPRARPDALAPDEAVPLRDALAAHLRRSVHVSVDGVDVTPVPGDFSTFAGDPSTSATLYPVFGGRAATQVALVLAYPVKAEPREVAFAWDDYPPELADPFAHDERAARAEVRLLVERGASERSVVLTADEPGFTWHADPAAERPAPLPVPRAPGSTSRRVPLLAGALGGFGLLLALRSPRTRARVLTGGLLLATGAALWPSPIGRLALPVAWTPHELPDRAEALAIFTPLHANIYRAFDYASESDVYDALARSVTGDLLERLYDEVHRSLVMADQGGAVAKVSAVRLISAEVEQIGTLGDDPAPAFRVLARWQVDGVVRHWGHSHARTNESLARYVVRATDDGWRIAGQEVLEQRRVSAAPLPDASAGEPR